MDAYGTGYALGTIIGIVLVLSVPAGLVTLVLWLLTRERRTRAGEAEPRIAPRAADRWEPADPRELRRDGTAWSRTAPRPAGEALEDVIDVEWWEPGELSR